jgi:hypothetical protein
MGLHGLEQGYLYLTLPLVFIFVYCKVALFWLPEIHIYLALDFGGIIMKEEHKCTYKCFLKYTSFVTTTNMATMRNFEMISGQLRAGSSWVSDEQVMEIL